MRGLVCAARWCILETVWCTAIVLYAIGKGFAAAWRER